MHATEVARPFHRDGWVYEEKIDGWRMVTTKADGAVRLVSRNGLKAWQEALERGYEGIVAKDPESRYIPVARSRG